MYIALQIEISITQQMVIIELSRMAAYGGTYAYNVHLTKFPGVSCF